MTAAGGICDGPPGTSGPRGPTIGAFWIIRMTITVRTTKTIAIMAAKPARLPRSDSACSSLSSMVKGQKSIHANEPFASRNSIDPHHREFSFITGSRLDCVDSEIRIGVNAEFLLDLLLGVVLEPSNIVLVRATKTHTVADAE